MYQEGISMKKDYALRAFWSLVKNNKKLIIIDTIIMVIANLALAIHPYVIGEITSLIQANELQQGFWWVVILFASNVVHWISWHGGDYFLLHRIVNVFYKFRLMCFKYVWRFDYKTFIEKPSGKISASINRIYGDFDSIYASYHYNFIRLIVVYPFFILLMARISPLNAIYYIIFMILTCSILWAKSKDLVRISKIYTNDLSEGEGKVFDSFANFVNVKSFLAEMKEFVAFRKNNNVLRKSRKKSDMHYINFWVLAAFLMRIILWPLVLFTNYILLKNGQISSGDFVTGLIVLMSFTDTFWNLVNEVSSIGRKFATYRQNYNYLFEGQDIVLEYYKNIQDPIIEDVKIKNNLTIHNLSFAYPDDPENGVLKDISITIKKNEKIGIVGKSGGGKSTFAKILLGFYDFEMGDITIDGQAVSSKQLARINTYVPQDTSLFQQSIQENIAYASSENVSQDEIVKAAKKAHIHDFVHRLPKGYDTLVGERGVKLSLGQRQRVAIARAFLKDSELLILDEATSALDSKTESLIQDSLEKLWHNKTVIAIAHRLSTLNNVDRIIVIDKGRVVEQGTKKELLNKKGIFSELWNQQKDGLI